jgi:hypothetical protein
VIICEMSVLYRLQDIFMMLIAHSSSFTYSQPILLRAIKIRDLCFVKYSSNKTSFLEAIPCRLKESVV